MAIHYGILLQHLGKKSTINFELTIKLNNLIGVRPCFGRKEFIDALNSMPKDTVLNTTTFDFAVSLVKLIAETITVIDPLSNKILIPCEDNMLHSIKKCVYDDTPWLTIDTENKYYLVHTNIPNSVAKTVGIKSLRQILLNNQSSFEIPCPSPKSLVSKKDNDGSLLINDIAEVAKVMSINEVCFFVDENTYATESVLEPSLAELQGPSVIIYFPRVILSSDQLTWLLSRHYQNMNDGYPEFYGNSISVCFGLTDCLQILTGSYLHMLDPCGKYFVDNNSGKNLTPKGKSFCFVDTNVLERFPDQVNFFLYTF